MRRIQIQPEGFVSHSEFQKGMRSEHKKKRKDTRVNPCLAGGKK